MQRIRDLEQVLLTGEVNDVVKQYPELNSHCLKVQLAMFRTKYSFQSSSEVAVIFQGMAPEVRGLFDQIEMLLRLLLVVPVSSAEAERGSSSLQKAENMAAKHYDTNTPQ